MRSPGETAIPAQAIGTFSSPGGVYSINACSSQHPRPRPPKKSALTGSEVAPGLARPLRFSAGIGPNNLLAKIAGKLEKPDGFRWLSAENMPGAIAHLALDDLPGISGAMKQRLYRAGISDVETLCRLDPRHARLIWRSVEGERFVRLLQGMDIPLMPNVRGGFGNSKVLAPAFRAPRQAYWVGRWLVETATA